MSAQRLDGTALAKGVREKLKAEIDQKLQTNPFFKPALAIVQVGERPDSSTYIRMKTKAAEEVCP